MRTVSTLVSAAALLLPLGCFPDIPGYDEIPNADEDSDGTDEDEPAPDGEDDEPEGETGGADEPEPGDAPYTIHGRARVAPAQSRAPLGFDGAWTPSTNAVCPFYPDAEPCHTLACWLDPLSQECIDVVVEYCTTHPEDPGCELPTDPDELPDLPGFPPEPGDDGEPDPSGDPPPPPDSDPSGDPPPPGQPPDRGDWACELEPDLPPCAACVDGATAACDEAWDEYCEDNHTSLWCHDDLPEPPAEVFPPASLEVLIHQIEFSTNADCSDPILIGEPDDPRYVDFATSPELFAGELPPPGEYPCVIITMSDHVIWSVLGDNRCAGAQEQDVHDRDGEEATVRLHLSTAGDPDGDAFEAPGIPLDGALLTDGLVSSTFEITFPQGVELRYENGTPHCELQRPHFRFLND